MKTPRGAQHRCKSQRSHSGTGLTLILPRLYRGSGAFAASPEPSNGAARDGTGPSGLGSKCFAAGLCRVPAALAGWGRHAASALLCKPRKKQPRPSFLRRHLPPPPPQPKGFFPSGAGGKMPRAPSKSSQGDTLVPQSVPGVAAVTPAQRNDAKPVLLWVGSGRWPQGFTPGGGGGETCWVRAGEAPKACRRAWVAPWAAPSHKPGYRPRLGMQENSSPCEGKAGASIPRCS